MRLILTHFDFDIYQRFGRCLTCRGDWSKFHHHRGNDYSGHFGHREFGFRMAMLKLRSLGKLQELAIHKNQTFNETGVAEFDQLGQMISGKLIS